MVRPPARPWLRSSPAPRDTGGVGGRRCSARQRASGGLGEANGQGRATNGENAEVGRATPGAALASSERRSTATPLTITFNGVIGPAATPAGRVPRP